MLGPNRIWLKANNLRSNKVKKATVTNRGIKSLKIIIIWFNIKKLIIEFLFNFKNSQILQTQHK